MKKYFVSILLVSLCLTLVYSKDAEARRRRKFKGVIIVNQILKLTGTVTRNGEEAAEFSGVKQGDVLETADKSSAVIRIPGLALFQMGPKTKFKLTQFSDRNESRLELIYGDVVALFRRVGAHEFKTPHGLIKLHGTTFFVDSPKDSKSDQICLVDGKIEVDLALTSEAQKIDPTPASAPTPAGSATATLQTATPTATPAPTPVQSGDAQLVSDGTEPKTCELSDKINLETNKAVSDLHTRDEIRELESLYELP